MATGLQKLVLRLTLIKSSEQLLCYWMWLVETLAVLRCTLRMSIGITFFGTEICTWTQCCPAVLQAPRPTLGNDAFYNMLVTAIFKH